MTKDSLPEGYSREQVPPHRDRRAGLILFGIIEVLLGVLCLLMAGFLVLGHLMFAGDAGGLANLRIQIPALMFYGVMAVLFVWLGVGSILCRRWARALVLILAWVWLGMGVLTVPMMAWLMPKALAAAPASGPALPAEAMTVILVIQMAVMSVFFILLPGVLVLFHRSAHTRRTCEIRDPVRRWTDECPLPVLAVACLVWWSAALMLCLPLAQLAMVPFFGVLLTGVPGALIMLGMACVLFWVGRSWYRLRIAGWWVLVAMVILFAISNVLTFRRVGMIEVYRRLDFPQAQLDLIEQQGWVTSGFILWSSLFWVVPMLAYLVWVKRYFRDAPGLDGGRSAGPDAPENMR